jgi:hypothetical protein
MKKIIDIPKEILKEIQHISIDENTNAKKWIEDLIIKEINSIINKSKHHNK